jgi:hypothetical protein
MKSLAKAESLVRKLQEHLGFRLQGSASIDTIRELKDSEGYPALVLSDGGNEAAEEPVIAIRVKAIDAVSKDIFGNSFDAFAPHTVEIGYDAAATSHLDLAKVMHECSKLGAKLVVKEVAEDAAVTMASLDSTQASLEMEFELRWPTKGV